jgi:hypothetical protein
MIMYGYMYVMDGWYYSAMICYSCLSCIACISIKDFECLHKNCMGKPSALPSPVEIPRLLRVVPDPSSVVRSSKFSRATMCTFSPYNCPLDADRHLLAPCAFCERYFLSSGLSKQRHSCSHRNTTPSQRPVCGCFASARSAVRGAYLTLAYLALRCLMVVP